MSIFGDSTPDFTAPDTDTVEETAEIQEEVSEETQETEATETKEETTDSQEEHSEELLAGKYKTVEQLAEAYKHAQRKISELSQQKPTTQQQPQVEQQQPDYNEVFWENFNNDPLKTMEFLVSNVVNQKTAPIHEQREQEVMIKNIESVAKDYKQISTEDGFTSIMQRVGEIAKEFGNESLAKNPSQRVLKMAAQELWGDSKAQLINKAKEQGRQEAEATRLAKMGVSSIGVTKKPNEAPKTEADHIIDGMMAASGKRGLFG